MRRVLFLALLLFVCSFATAQRSQPRPQPLDAAQLDKIATAPSLDQAILRLAAEKLRQGKKPMETVEVQMTFTVNMHLGCVQYCWNWNYSSQQVCRPVKCYD
jgi:hypothetical protein